MPHVSTSIGMSYPNSNEMEWKDIWINLIWLGYKSDIPFDERLLPTYSHLNTEQTDPVMHTGGTTERGRTFQLKLTEHSKGVRFNCRTEHTQQQTPMRWVHGAQWCCLYSVHLLSKRGMKSVQYFTALPGRWQGAEGRPDDGWQRGGGEILWRGCMMKRLHDEAWRVFWPQSAWTGLSMRVCRIAVVWSGDHG